MNTCGSLAVADADLAAARVLAREARQYPRPEAKGERP